MRALLLTSLSAALLSGCLTTQENPNYEFSSRYEGDANATHQYAEAQPAETTAVTYEAATSQATYAQQPSVQQAVTQYSTVSASTDMAGIAPTDSTYGSRDVTGTPGYMAMQADRQANLAPSLPTAQMVETAPMAAAGTPIDYDYSRNLIVADVDTSGSRIADTVRVIPNAGSAGAYTVQSGDTVYSLSRRTCVGVNVIKSLNGLDTNYGINIGQTLTLPASVC